MLFLSPGVALSLYFWLDKSTFIEYAKLLGIKKWFYIDEFLQAASNDSELTYPAFLLQHWNNWATRLLSCPICLSPWVAGLFAIPFLLSYPALLIVPAILFLAYISLLLYFFLCRIAK